MSLLRMIPVDLLSGFADLLDDEEDSMLRDYTLDLGILVTRKTIKR